MDKDLERLGRAVKQAQHRQFRALEKALGEVGTTVVQWDALRAIAAAPGASAHQLAMATFQTDQAFGTLATRLLRQNLIERQPGDGKRIAHRLTAKGETLLAKGNKVAERVRAALYAGVPKADRRTLSRILEQLLEGDEADLDLGAGMKARRSRRASDADETG